MTNQFLSCDWGTSSFRLRLIDIASGQIIAESAAGEGIAGLYASWKEAGNAGKDRIRFYLPVIQKHIERIEQDTAASTANIPVMVSGMSSASIGMLELPYAELPFSLSGEGLLYKKIEGIDEFPRDLVIISGARTATDTMRGEETQLIGCANGPMMARQIFIFTGTHSKHITTDAGKATDTATYMTGEFFDLLTTKSILADSVWPGAAIEENGNKQAFERGVTDSLHQNLLHDSFMVRTGHLLGQFSKTENYFYLSGLLIGSELRQLTKKEMELITIVGEKKLASQYRLALEILGIRSQTRFVDAATATIQGQLVLYKRVYGGW